MTDIPVPDEKTILDYSSTLLTGMIPTRWPYAPDGAKIRLVPAGTFTNRWGGRWSFLEKVAYVNQTLDADVGFAVCAHELAHGRWSAPLPDLPGEEGAAGLVVEMFDEVRTNRFAIAAHPPVRADLRPWATHALSGQMEMGNPRAVALGYGYLFGNVMAGLLDDGELHDVRHQFEDAVGNRWLHQLDAFLIEAFNQPAGATHSLVGIARRWDRWVTAEI
jgi:hypothetical protein